MKVLLVAAASPEPARTGQRLRYRQHLEGLSAAGATAGLLTFLRDGGDAKGLEALAPRLAWAEGVAGGNRRPAHLLAAALAGEPVHLAAHRSAPLESALDRALDLFRPDAVIAGNVYLAPLLDRVPKGILRVVDEQNDEVEIWELEARHHPSAARRLFARRNGARLAAVERRLVASADLTLAVSEHDRQRFEARGRTPVEVVPNGIDAAAWGEPVPAAERDGDELLFTGTDAARNLDALAAFVERTWPLVRREHPAARLRVAGAFSEASRRRFAGVAGVTFTGPVPDIRPYFRRAAVYVAPFRLGGGSRLKILEAGAAGLPVVSTVAGVRGLDLRPGFDFLLAEEGGEMAGEIVRLLAHATHRSDLGARLRTTVLEKYDVRRLGRDLLAILARAAAR